MQGGNAKSRSVRPAAPVNSIPAAVTAADRIVLEIRKFIAAAIFFNQQAAENVGLGLTDLQMLNLLQLHGPSTPSRLAGWTGLSSGGVTVALDRLEKAGYIRRAANPGDRRSLLITLMPAPMRRLGGMYEGIEKETRRRLALLTPPDLEAVIRFFETMHSTGADRNSLRKA